MTERFHLRLKLLAIAALAGLTVLSGCGGSGGGGGSVGSDTGLPAEAIAVQQAFEDASPSKKYPVMEMMGLIRTGATNRMAYAEVLPQLQKLAENPTLTPEQKQSLDALLAKIRSDLGGGAR